MKRAIDGVILLDKALGTSSHSALQQVKRLFRATKAGHTGSLDPLATGILPICLGQATKLSQFLLNATKRYIAKGQLGQQTNTADAQGKIICTLPFQHITQTDIVQVLPHFLGKTQQIPPMYCALKKNGKALYKFARQGIEFEREAREIEIEQLELLSFDKKTATFELEVSCSKGTYIRTLVEDIAKKLDSCAFMCALRRIGFATFDISQTVSAKQLLNYQDNLTMLDGFIYPMAYALPSCPSIMLSDYQVQSIQHGKSIRYENTTQTDKIVDNVLVKLLTPQNLFLGIGIYTTGQIRPKRLFLML